MPHSFYRVVPCLVLAIAPLAAQTPVLELDEIPVFHATAVSRSIKSVNFQYRQGATDMALTGTALASKATGTVHADSKTGATKLDLRADHLPAPWTIDPSMLTYVVWAVTPDGRPEAVGELAVGTGDDAHLSASSQLQAFGLIVTAEPYFAVTQPSDLVVMEATITPQTSGTISSVDAKYELLPRNSYLSFLPPARQAEMKIRDKSPVDLLQARHAIAIAESFGASRYANDTMGRAYTDLKNAEAFFANNADKKKVEALARNVVQLSEDARLISVRKRQADAAEQERLTANRNLQQAKTDTERESLRRNLAETDARMAKVKAEESGRIAQEERQRRALADREVARATQAQADAQAETEVARRTVTATKQEAEAAIAQARMESETKLVAANEARTQTEMALKAAESKVTAVRAQADAAAQQATSSQSEAEAARAKVMEATKQAEADRVKAMEAAKQADADRADAARLLADARNRQAQLSEEAQNAKLRAEKSDTERVKAREELRRQLNVVLVTKQTARGLVVNMSGVLFDTGKNVLNPGAREKLAKIAGILQTHPDLKLEVEGHTDSTGSQATNLKLSAARAEAVRTFLTAQGVNASSVTAIGKGPDSPVTTNATAAGRQQNRRVEIVVSGGGLEAN